MSKNLSLETETLERDGDKLLWPEDISGNTYTLVYKHSELKFEKGPSELQVSKLYEAWAFDGKTSWHIWQRDGSWVCTKYDARKTDENFDDIFEEEQILMRKYAQALNKNTLIIHHRLDYDNDFQAYIAYSCPINIKAKEENNV